MLRIESWALIHNGFLVRAPSLLQEDDIFCCLETKSLPECVKLVEERKKYSDLSSPNLEEEARIFRRNEKGGLEREEERDKTEAEMGVRRRRRRKKRKWGQRQREKQIGVLSLVI